MLPAAAAAPAALDGDGVKEEEPMAFPVPVTGMPGPTCRTYVLIKSKQIMMKMTCSY